MTFRGTMPPGPVYNGQGQQRSQHAQHPQYQHQHQQPQLLPQSQPAHPQYASPYANGTPQYQHVQYSQPTYTQQQQQSAQYYPSTTPDSRFSNYDGYAPSPQTTIAAPVQFVDPSFLQRPPPPKPTTYIPPMTTPVSAPVPAPISTPAPAVTHVPTPTTRVPAQSSQPAAAALTPQAHRAPQQSQQPHSAKDSPRLDKQPHSQAGSAKSTSKDVRRVTSGGAIAKSPTMSPAPHVETLPLLLRVAEDCFTQANTATYKIARTMAADEVAEHHKLVATGLGCLEIALKSNKLWPRLEARLRLRYAGILVDETTNIMEAETALTKGISVCEKHRFMDLKYSSQFLLMKALFQRNHKAAFKSLDAHIADCTTYKHIHWIYAFRFLKAAFYLQAGTPADHQALDNLRRIAATASGRGDKAVFVIAMLLEGLAHLSSKRDEWITRVQTCIAQASKLQLDDSVHLPQIDILRQLLDLACSLHEKSLQTASQKLNALQTRLEEIRQSPAWATLSDEILLPIKRVTGVSPTISNDTGAVLRPGEGETDFLVLSTLPKQEVYALAYVLNGIVALHRSTTPGKSTMIWTEALRLLEDNKAASTPQSLPEALRHADWVKELSCYTHILVGLQAATLSDWAKVNKCLELIQEAQPSSGFLEIMTLYLTGVFKQGSAQLVEAIEIWKDPKFAIGWNKDAKTSTSHIETELSILAALNRLWIMHEPASRDEAEMVDLVEQLRPLCEDNPDSEIKTAYNLVLASIVLAQPMTLSIQQVKRHIQLSLSGAQSTNNIHCLSMALNIMRCRLFENVVGEQAVKSAKAGLAQAKKSGNLLWMSVAQGMLAQSFEMQGAIAEAREAREAGMALANEAFTRTQV